MSRTAVLGAGAFGTALAIALARHGARILLWARAGADGIASARENAARLPGIGLPASVEVTGSLARAAGAEVLLLALPMQACRAFLEENRALLGGRTTVACCKGIDLTTGETPDRLIARRIPDAAVALLSGPSFAQDIAAGLPTALTLAMADDAAGAVLQARLATPTLRLSRSTDLTGVALGGALKNVMAIACGVAIGAGLGESARAALMTRGYAEMRRFAVAAGAQDETLAGLSGLGDLALTCTSEKSRNYRYGLALGRQGRATATETTEGIATALAVAALAGEEMPVTRMVAALVEGRIGVAEAAETLLSRPLRPE